MTRKPKPTPKRTVKVVRTSYQPSKAELEADARVGATFEKAVNAITKPVSIRYVECLESD